MGYSIEDVLLTYKKQIIAGLNTRIAAINASMASTDVTNYGQVITLPTLDTSNIYMLVAPQQLPNATVFLSMEIPQGGYTISALGGATLQIQLKIILLDPSDGSVDVMALRYIDALLKTFYPLQMRGDAYTVHKMENIEAESYITVLDNRSWREIGISLTSVLALV